MNWDQVINIGMFALGCCFIIVAMAQLLFGNYDEDEQDEPRRYRPYCKHGKDGNMVKGEDCDICQKGDKAYDDKFESEQGYRPYGDCDYYGELVKPDEIEMKNGMNAGMNQVQTDITEQDDPLVAVMMIRAASEVAQQMIDEMDKD